MNTHLGQVVSYSKFPEDFVISIMLLHKIISSCLILAETPNFVDLGIYQWTCKLNYVVQAIYLEEVLREGFSHPSVNGIMLWTALHPNGCYQMCLTDNNFQNLLAGEMVDKLHKNVKQGRYKVSQGQFFT